MKHPDSIAGDNWQSIVAQAAPLRLTAAERYERFKLEAMTEIALRVVGILAVAISLYVVFFEPFASVAGETRSNSILAAIFAATGLVVYAYGTRGFRREFKLDTSKKTLILTKINVRGRSRVSRTVDIDDIESIFARRPANAGDLTLLQIRVVNGSTPIAVLGGQFEELKALHHEMCGLINASRPDTSKAVGHKTEARNTPKPKLFASANA